ncbi:enoyl-CoA hydratase [Chloroflexus islandicus]|uniref:Probable enoyl-CoA hydratase echA8 n=1 Tax=Chloroflexus islandicus TaxID=1707952 RepID=A0A178MFP0_9CHLR|nr:enoyl-CoA hydratase-related protein [Chloroflexus islandicus]OAN47559.1 enoyl-CoA hydratase [Chloroflexus islandicus]
MSNEPLVISSVEGPIAILTLNRPQALNALSPALIDNLIRHLEMYDADDLIRAIIITGAGRAFAAGADIKAMANATPIEMLTSGMIARWARIAAIRKPVIAAVNGYALGGGCELAMMCDIILASETAQFGQPEINIGIIPGAGGTQRLTRALGPYRAMEMVLTGATISAHEAAAHGLVNRVCPPETLLDEARRVAQTIAAKSPLAVQLAKEAVRAAAETTVREGLAIELRNFYLLFASEDQKEGMRAFIEKRAPNFSGR